MAGQAFATPNTSVVPSENGYSDSSKEEKGRENDYCPSKRLTVTFRNISITVNKTGTDYGDTFLSDLDPRTWFSWISKSSGDKKVRPRISNYHYLTLLT